MQIIATVYWYPLEIDAIPEPGKSTIARLFVEMADVRGNPTIRSVRASVQSEAGNQCFASASRSFKGNVSASFKISATSRFTAKLYALRNKEASEIFGNQEAAFPLDADSRFVEMSPTVLGCLICDVAVGRDVPFGYRESSFADGPNSVGVWLCEVCFDRYLSRGDFSFLVRTGINQ